MALRRARYAGRFDVDAMLAETTPHEMNEAIAFDAIEPDPFHRIAEILKRGFAMLCLSDTVTPDDFEPSEMRMADQESTGDGGDGFVSPDHQVQMIRSRLPIN